MTSPINYGKQTWANGEAGNTPLEASRLNHIEDGIVAATAGVNTAKTAVTDLATTVATKAAQTDLTALSASVTAALAGKAPQSVADTVATLSASVATKYSRPSTGIPAVDLDTAAQAALSSAGSLAIDSVDSRIARLTLRTTVPAPAVTIPEDDPVTPPVTPNPGAMPIPDSYIQRTGDPMPLADKDRPPSRNGQYVGRLAAPHLSGWPDETNTGLAVNNVAFSALTDIADVVIWEDYVLVGGTRYNRPTTGSTVIGPLTIYPKAAPITHVDSAYPVTSVLERAHCRGGVHIPLASQNTLIIDSQIVGTTTPVSAINHVGGGGAFLTVRRSRIHGHSAAETVIKGRAFFMQKCNVTGSADAIPVASSSYGDFNFIHGRTAVGTYHLDGLQALSIGTTSAARNADFGGWNSRWRRNTVLAYGGRTGNAVFQMGDIQADIQKLLFDDNLVFGGNYSFNVNWFNYEQGYGTSGGVATTKQSSYTGKAETHPFVANAFFLRTILGRNFPAGLADPRGGGGFAGGGSSGADYVPRYGDPALSNNYGSEGAHIKEWRKYKDGGKYGEPAPITSMDWTWDGDNTPVGGSLLPFGLTDLAAVTAATGLDFTRLPAGG